MPKSTSFERTRDTMLLFTTSRTTNVTPGCSCWNSRMTSGNSEAAHEGRHARRMTPLARVTESRAFTTAASNSPTSLRKVGKRSRPRVVSSTLRVVRSNSRKPSSSSNWRMRLVRAGCERCRTSAARLKLAVEATVTKARIWPSVTCTGGSHRGGNSRHDSAKHAGGGGIVMEINRVVRLAGVLLAMTLVASSLADATEPSRPASLQANLNCLTDQGKIPGAVVLVAHDGKLSYQGVV